MIDEPRLLKEKLAEFLGWERIKRREKVLLSASFYSLLASLLVLPARGFLPAWASPYVLLLFFFSLLAPGFFLLNRWRERDSLRAVSSLDKALRLEERAITAREILGRSAQTASEQLVLEEAVERLQALDAPSLFPRRLTWQAYSALPLFLLWFLLVWFDVGIRFENDLARKSKSMAQKVREYSSDLLEKTKSQGLPESLKVARELDQVAERGLKKEISENKLRENLAGIASRIRDMGRMAAMGSESLSTATTREGLRDLKAELDALKESMASPEMGKEGRGIDPDLLGRLANFPRLKGEVQRGLPQSERLDGKELRQFLEKLERDVARDLDRRALADAQEFIELLLEGDENQAGQKGQQLARAAKEGSAEEGERVRGKGTVPGDELGTKDRLGEAPPLAQTNVATHLKGILGEGKSGTFVFRGMPSGGRSKVAQEEVTASYRRQAEEELASERIPQELRETIRSYFLSLGMMGGGERSSGASR